MEYREHVGEHINIPKHLQRAYNTFKRKLLLEFTINDIFTGY